jgi:hypothetical protein
MLPVSLDCPLWIAPSLFSNIYLSCVPNVDSVRDPWIVHSGLPLLFSLTFIINTKFTGDKGDLFLNKVNGYTRIYAKYFVTVYFTIGVIAWIRKSAWRFGLPKLFECYLFSIIFSLVLFVIIKKNISVVRLYARFNYRRLQLVDIIHLYIHVYIALVFVQLSIMNRNILA